MSNLLGIIDILDDDCDLRLDELSAASVSAAVDAASPVTQPNWIPFSGYSFGTIDLGIIVSKMRQYISSHGGFRFVMKNHYFGVSGRSHVPDVLAGSFLDTTYFQRWPQYISFECREIRKRKGCEHSGCPFSVRIAFDRSVGSYVVKLCMCLHTGYVINLSSIPGHVKFESDLFVDEREQLAKFGKIGYTGLQSKSALCRLFSGRIYDSDMIYRVVKKARNLHYGDATDYMLKLVELGNSHRSKGGVFERASNKGGHRSSSRKYPVHYKNWRFPLCD